MPPTVSRPVLILMVLMWTERGLRATQTPGSAGTPAIDEHGMNWRQRSICTPFEDCRGHILAPTSLIPRTIAEKEPRTSAGACSNDLAVYRLAPMSPRLSILLRHGDRFHSQLGSWALECQFI